MASRQTKLEALIVRSRRSRYKVALMPDTAGLFDGKVAQVVGAEIQLVVDPDHRCSMLADARLGEHAGAREPLQGARIRNPRRQIDIGLQPVLEDQAQAEIAPPCFVVPECAVTPRSGV